MYIMHKYVQACVANYMYGLRIASLYPRQLLLWKTYFIQNMLSVFKGFCHVISEGIKKLAVGQNIATSCCALNPCCPLQGIFVSVSVVLYCSAQQMCHFSSK